MRNWARECLAKEDAGSRQRDADVFLRRCFFFFFEFLPSHPRGSDRRNNSGFVRRSFRGPSNVVLAEVVKASWAALPGGGYKRAPPTDDAAWQTAPTACTAGAALCGEWRDGEKRKGGEQIELDATFWGPGWKVRREK